MARRSWQLSPGALKAENPIAPRKESGNTNTAFRGTIPLEHSVLRGEFDHRRAWLALLGLNPKCIKSHSSVKPEIEHQQNLHDEEQRG
jgi:hypothetical protein